MNRHGNATRRPAGTAGSEGSRSEGGRMEGGRPEGGRMEVIRRRSASISMVAGVALATVVLSPVAVPLLVVLDVLRARLRLPLARLYAFAICWSWLELAGVSIAAGLWLCGRGRDLRAHYRLQAWWADKIMGSLHLTCGLRPDVQGADALLPGPTILLVHHASLADSLLTAWVVTNAVGMRPRVVMKRELLVDPCLDIVGNRLPNSFVDRRAEDSGPELASIAEMMDGLAQGDVAVLFPEGTRANPDKRTRAIESIRRHDPDRATRIAVLKHLLPPRPGGAATMLDAAPGAGVCVAWHVGFGGLDSFPGIIRALGRERPPVRIRFRRVEPPPGPVTSLQQETRSSADQKARSQGPPEPFVNWLDDLWLGLDRDVDRLLASG